MIQPATTGLIIIGGDPGIAAPGLTVVARRPGGGYELLASKVVRSKSKNTIERLEEMGAVLVGFCVKFKPAYLVLERQEGAQVGAFRSGQKTGDNSKTLRSVGHMSGIAQAFGVKVIERTPQQAKIAVLGPRHAHAEKKQVQEAVQRIFRVPKLAQDACDGGALAISGFQMLPNERG